MRPPGGTGTRFSDREIRHWQKYCRAYIPRLWTGNPSLRSPGWTVSGLQVAQLRARICQWIPSPTSWRSLLTRRRL